MNECTGFKMAMENCKDWSRQQTTHQSGKMLEWSGKGTTQQHLGIKHWTCNLQIVQISGGFRLIGPRLSAVSIIHSLDYSQFRLSVIPINCSLYYPEFRCLMFICELFDRWHLLKFRRNIMRMLSSTRCP